MKKKNIQLFLLLSFALPFLKANAPAPFAYGEKYDEFSISFLCENFIEADQVYEYSYLIENLGDGYISLDESHFNYLSLNQRTDSWHFEDLPLIKPYETQTINLYSENQLNGKNQIKDFTIAGFANSCLEEISFTLLDTTEKEAVESNQNLYSYTYYFETDFKGYKDNYCSFLGKIEGEGESYIFYNELDESPFSFVSSLDLNVDEYKLTGIFAIKGREKYKTPFFTFFFVSLIVISLMGIISVFGLIVLAIVLISVKLVRKKNKI